MVVLGLVALAAIVSTTELVATQLFSVLILPKTDRNTAVTALLVVLFLVFFGGLRVINFLAREVPDQRLRAGAGRLRRQQGQRLVALGDGHGGHPRSSARSAASPSWWPRPSCWPRCSASSWCVAVAAVGFSLSFLYRRQLATQREFRAAQLAYRSVDNATKVRTRVIAGETGALFGYAGVVVLIGVLLVDDPGRRRSSRAPASCCSSRCGCSARRSPRSPRGSCATCAPAPSARCRTGTTTRTMSEPLLTIGYSVLGRARGDHPAARSDGPTSRC